MREYVVYDRYLRPIIELGHCHFKGGKDSSSTTTRDIPEQSANEKALENFLLDTSSLGGNMAPYAYQAFAGSLNDAFTPKWDALFSEYLDRNDTNMDTYSDLLKSTLSDYQGAADTYNRNMTNALNEYKTGMNNALSKYNQAYNKRTGLWDDLVNGVLPDQYAANRQAALNADLKGTVGSAINGLASRGVINSGVGNKALDDISQSASDTLAKRYADDLALEASLLNQDRANYRDAYDVASNTAQGKYSNSSDAYTNAMNQYANLYKTKLGEANNWISTANGSNQDLYNAAATGQTASLQVPSQYLSYAQSLSQPVENLYNTMYSGRMGTGSTTTTQSDGGAGIWSAVGGLGSAFILCFTGDTLVTTPDGYKEIANVQEGDTVLSVHDGKIVPKKVIRTYGPNIREIIEVRFDNGTVWHCTKGQRYFDGKHFGYVDYGITPAMVYQGNDTKIVSVKGNGDIANVYDIKLEGFAGENVWFANDVAAEGFGD